MLNFCWIILNRNTSLKAISTTKVCSGVGYKNKQPSSEPILHMGFLFEFSLFRNLISKDQYLRNVLQEMVHVPKLEKRYGLIVLIHIYIYIYCDIAAKIFDWTKV